MFAALLPPRAKLNPRQVSLAEQAGALNVVLRKEFGIPFVFYHATTGQAVPDRPTTKTDSWPSRAAEAAIALTPEEVLRLAADTQPDVTVLADGRYQLTMIFYDANRPLVVAAGLFVGLARNRAETEREKGWLEQWLQSVSDRLRLTEQFQRQQCASEDQHAQAKVAWEGLLAVDHVLRRLRIHKEPTRNRQRILETAHELLGTQTLVWVPQDTAAPLQWAGEPCLSEAECRSLAATLGKHPDMRANGHLLCNDLKATSWAAGFPNLTTVLAFALTEPEAPGCVLGLNKKGPGGADIPVGEPEADKNAVATFRRSDAALLTPFVALLRAARRRVQPLPGPQGPAGRPGAVADLGHRRQGLVHLRPQRARGPHRASSWAATSAWKGTN